MYNIYYLCGVEKYYVYIHYREKTKEPFYIGISNSVKYKRAYNMVIRSKEWKEISNEYGVYVFIFAENLSKKEALRIENELIIKFGRIDKDSGILCNKNDGGCGNFNPSEECRELKRIAFLGSKNPNYGKKMTQEQKEKISQTMLLKKIKRPMPKYQKEKISKANKGKIKNNKIVINYQTKEEFSSIKECALFYNISYDSCWRILNKGQIGLPIKYKNAN